MFWGQDTVRERTATPLKSAGLSVIPLPRAGNWAGSHCRILKCIFDLSERPTVKTFSTIQS